MKHQSDVYDWLRIKDDDSVFFGECYRIALEKCDRREQYSLMNQINLWTSADHALGYLSKADSIPHRTEGEAVLLEQVPKTVNRILDLGTGDGRLLALLKIDRPQAEGIAVDFSATMLEAVKKRFAGDETVQVIAHNLDQPLPELGSFDAVVSSFAIHHVTHDRKRSLYTEIFQILEPGGIFCNLAKIAEAPHS